MPRDCRGWQCIHLDLSGATACGGFVVRQILWQVLFFGESSRFLAGLPVRHMPQSPCDIQKDGRGAQIRTGDPLLPKQVRYQAALHPDPRITKVFWLFKQAFKSTKVKFSGHFWTKSPLQIPLHLFRP